MSGGEDRESWRATALWSKEKTRDHIGEQGLLAFGQEREDERLHCYLGEEAVLQRAYF